MIESFYVRKDEIKQKDLEIKGGRSLVKIFSMRILGFMYKIVLTITNTISWDYPFFYLK